MSEEHGPVKIDLSTPLLKGAEKENAYVTVSENLSAVLQEVTDPIAKMATVASMLTEYFPRSQHFWTGFYRADRRDNGKNQLVVGPYQGTLGCIFIPYENGVCGAVATLEKTKIVPDVDHIDNDPEIKNVIHCDSTAKSEIVVPIFGKDHKLIGVYDVDSTEYDAFDEIDQRYLEAIMNDHFSMYDSLMHP